MLFYLENGLIEIVFGLAWTPRFFLDDYLCLKVHFKKNNPRYKPLGTMQQ